MVKINTISNFKSISHIKGPKIQNVKKKLNGQNNCPLETPKMQKAVIELLFFEKKKKKTVANIHRRLCLWKGSIYLGDKSVNLMAIQEKKEKLILLTEPAVPS